MSRREVWGGLTVSANLTHSSAATRCRLESMPTRTDHPLSGNEQFHSAGQALGFTVLDFWRWGASQLAGNALRGLVAEFLVGRAVGSATPSRVEWDAVDVVTPRGTTIEVKCAGYVQTWAQTRLSSPSFDISPKRSWFDASNTYAPDVKRRAAVYVFALHHHQERESLDPCDVTQWSFYVVPTATLDSAVPRAKRIGLQALGRLAGQPVAYAALRAQIERLESTL